MNDSRVDPTFPGKWAVQVVDGAGKKEEYCRSLLLSGYLEAAIEPKRRAFKREDMSRVTRRPSLTGTFPV